jgi:hypothetical protein
MTEDPEEGEDDKDKDIDDGGEVEAEVRGL